MHVVAFHRGLQRRGDAVAVHADVETDGGGAGEEAVEMTVEEREAVVMEPDALPDPVADEEPAVEHGDLRVVAGEELAVDVDLDRRVALVGHCLMG